VKIAGRRDYLLTLESVAMTDIVLNMFIFFFISFSLVYTFSPARVRKLLVKLPESTSSAPLKKKGALYITVSAEGLLYMDQNLVNDKELREQIEMTCKNNPGRNIIVCADKMVPFTHVVSVLDILHKAGVKNLNVAVATAH